MEPAVEVEKRRVPKSALLVLISVTCERYSSAGILCKSYKYLIQVIFDRLCHTTRPVIPHLKSYCL